MKSNSKDKILIEIVNKTRDIPFQFIGSRDINSMLKAGAGTCNAKHMYLNQQIKKLGYKTRFIIDKFNLGDFLKGLNQKESAVIELKQLAARLKPYFHTYLQIFKDKRWINLDITFDSPLKKYGFITSTSWNGKNNLPLPHSPIKSFFVKNSPDEFKSKILAQDTVTNKTLRDKFFTLLNDYLCQLRSRRTAR